jgi:hypothetical protein
LHLCDILEKRKLQGITAGVTKGIACCGRLNNGSPEIPTSLFLKPESVTLNGKRNFADVIKEEN